MTTAAPAADESQDYPYWRRNLRALPLINVLSSLAFGLAFPYIPLAVRELGVAESNLEAFTGNLMIVFYIIGFIASPIWGGIADHYGRKLMLLRASLGMGAFFFLIPFSAGPWWFLALFWLVGVFNGFIPAGMALLVANTPAARIGYALSLASMGALLGKTLGPVVGATLAATLPSYRFLFGASGAFMLVSGLLTILFVREVRVVPQGRYEMHWLRDLRVLLAVPHMSVLFFLAFVNTIHVQGNTTVLSIYAIRLLRESGDPWAISETVWVGAVAVGLSVASTVSLPVWGRLMDRYSSTHLLSLGMLASLLTHLPLPFVQSVLQLTLARTAFGLLGAATAPVLIRLIKLYSPPGMDARAIAYASSFQFIGMGVAPFVAGLIGPLLGLRVYFGLVAALTLAGYLVWVFRPRDTPLVA
ncbi:MAG: MFS transporter [Candidatus Lambdaproteobacteria bacterium]|nr:MFS transporter [Candidatus Lambdaproteobacteria bacterium]